jgi:uncharacterized membrane protein YvbJ
MKRCPHCNSSFPENMEKCPQCGASYWDSDNNGLNDGAGSQEEEEEGCLSILIFHFLIALGLAILFVLSGFIINLLVHFEANQVKIAWLAASLLLGGTISFMIRRLQRKKKRGKAKEDEKGTSDFPP